MAMSRTIHAVVWCLLLVMPACEDSNRRPVAASIDCSVTDGYELLTIFHFEGGESGFYLYSDHTPGGVPNPDAGSNVALAKLDPPHCGSTGALELVAYGNNYWGAGFGDWQHNSSPADGTGYEGISFWARSPGNTDKTFLLNVHDKRTLKTNRTPPVATSSDQDLDGDGLLGPGDIASGTECRLPPPQSMGDPSCYYGGTQPPSAVTRVPEPDECGNAFHTYVTTTADWQYFLIPWERLVQWPCPNRLEGGINPADIRMLEVRLVQGTHYDIWLDDISFYRLRADADAGS
jgi:hypothetical protein